MASEKDLLEKSIDLLVDKAEDASDLAKAQRANADKQHETAHKLEALSRDLKIDAAEIKGELRAAVEEIKATVKH